MPEINNLLTDTRQQSSLAPAWQPLFRNRLARTCNLLMTTSNQLAFPSNQLAFISHQLLVISNRLAFILKTAFASNDFLRR